MQPSANTKEGKGRRKSLRWLFLPLLGLLAGSALLTALAYFLVPYTASTGWFRRWVQASASRALHRRVAVESMVFDWKTGLRMESIRLWDDPRFQDGPMAAAGALKLTVNFPDLFKKRVLTCRILLDNVRLRIVRKKEGTTNLQHFFKALTPETKGKGAGAVSDQALGLPLSDMDLRCRVRGMAIQFEDRAQNKKAALSGASLDICVPSLFKKPLSVKASGSVRFQGKPLSPFSASLKIKDLFHAKGTLQPERLSAAMKVSAPGLFLELNGDLPKKKVKGLCRADLGKVLPLLFAVLPGRPFPKVKAGTVRLEGRLAGLDAGRAAFQINLRIQGVETLVSLHGPPVSGPLTLTLNQKGTVRFPQGDVQIETGSLSINASRMTWQGSVKGLAGPAPHVQLTLGPARLHLLELTAAARPFLKIPLPLDLMETASPHLEWHRLEISGALFEGRFHLAIQDLSGRTGRFRTAFSATGGAVTLDALTLSLSRLNGEIKDFFPERLSILGTAAFHGLVVQGKTGLRIDSASISALQLETRKLQTDKNAPLGFTLPFTLSLALKASGIRVPGLEPTRLGLSGLRVWGDLGSDLFAEAALEGMRLQWPGFRFKTAAFGRLRGDLLMELGIPRLRISGLSPLTGTMEGATLRLSLDRVVETTLKADAIDLKDRKYALDASIRTDLGALDAILPDLFKNRRRLFGKVHLKCRASGRLAPLPESLASAMEALLNPQAPFFDTAEVSLKFSKAGISWPIPGGPFLEVKEVTTASPLVWAFDGKKASGRLAGDIRIKRIRPFLPSVVPSSGKPSPFSLHLGLSGTHDRFNAAASLLLDIQPMGIQGTTTFSLEGLNALLKPAVRQKPSTWGGLLSGRVNATVSIPETTKISINSDTFLQGKVELFAEIESAPETGMRVLLFTRTKDLDIQKENAFHIQNLNTRVSFEKRFEAPAAGLSRKPRPEHLSERVIQDRVLGAPAPLAFDTLATLDSMMQARLNNNPAVVFGPARFHLSRQALTLRHAVADLSFEDGLPFLRHLELQLLGGSVMGSARVSKKEKDLIFDARIFFSGIDLKAVAGKMKARAVKEDATLAGQLEIAFPLVPSLRRLIENLRASLQFTHIGSNALRRILFIMDPYESNETIVSQRRLLRSGRPRWIDLNIRNGILSLDGEVVVKGVPVRIPHLERLNMAAVSGIEAYEGPLAALEGAVRLFKGISGPTLPLAFFEKTERK